jgi:chemotaxis protein CheD
MGEIAVGRSGDTLVTLLGSCVAVVLSDPPKMKAAMAHIQLPTASPGFPVDSSGLAVDSAGKFADTAIAELMREISGTQRSQLVAHIAGGADMFQTSRLATIGQLNIQAAERILGELNLKIATHACGGTLARRVRFEVSTGIMVVEDVDRPTEAIT